MYICNDCGAVFDNPKTQHMVFGLNHRRDNLCPSCFNDDFEITHKTCPFTGDFIRSSQDLSDSARKTITDELNALLDHFSGTDEQRDIAINVIAEWIENV